MTFSLKHTQHFNIGLSQLHLTDPIGGLRSPANVFAFVLLPEIPNCQVRLEDGWNSFQQHVALVRILYLAAIFEPDKPRVENLRVKGGRAAESQRITFDGHNARLQL